MCGYSEVNFLYPIINYNVSKVIFIPSVKGGSSRVHVSKIKYTQNEKNTNNFCLFSNLLWAVIHIILYLSLWSKRLSPCILWINAMCKGLLVISQF